MHLFKKKLLKSLTYHSAELYRIKHMFRKQDTKKIAIMAVCICLSIMLLGASRLPIFQGQAAALTIDGVQVTVLSSKQEAQNVLEQYLAQKSNEMNMKVSSVGQVNIIELPKDTGLKPDSANDALKILTQTIAVGIKAAVIQVDGKDTVAVANEDAAKNILENVKAAYINDDDVIIDAKFREEVKIKTKVTEPSNILAADIAKNVLIYGAPQKVLHQIESSDETLWTISKQYDISIEDLQAANPGLTSGDLKVGSSVRLKAIAPLVNCVIVKQVVTTAEIPFEVKRVNDSSIYRGTEKVVTQGVAGEKELTLNVVTTNGVMTGKQVVGSKVLQDPVTKVVQRGTKLVVASRGTGTIGILNWPASSRRITSSFGYRSRGYHTGMDIDGCTGDTIRACEAGTVFFAGWASGYGYTIKIDHGDGLQTWYAHLSQIDVSCGDKVSSGQKIGEMGSTGNSTGSHLHLEVRINGTPYNPIRYLK